MTFVQCSTDHENITLSPNWLLLKFQCLFLEMVYRLPYKFYTPQIFHRYRMKLIQVHSNNEHNVFETLSDRVTLRLVSLNCRFTASRFSEPLGFRS